MFQCPPYMRFGRQRRGLHARTGRPIPCACHAPWHAHALGLPILAGKPTSKPQESQPGSTPQANARKPTAEKGRSQWAKPLRLKPKNHLVGKSRNSPAFLRPPSNSLWQLNDKLLDQHWSMFGKRLFYFHES